jgi:hypothetical protein
LTNLGASEWIAIGSIAVALIALIVACYAIRRSNRNSSVATLVTLNEGFRQAWQRFLAPEADKNYEFSELSNLLEIACAIHLEKSLFGVSRELSREYIEQVLLLLERNGDAQHMLAEAIHSPTTFKYIQRFRIEMRRRRPKLGIMDSSIEKSQQA